MKIKWHFPLALFIKGPSPDAMDLASEFTHKGVAVRVELGGDTPTPIKIPDKPEVFTRTARAITFIIDDTRRASIQKSEYPQLLSLMVSTMNRVLRSIRNAGVVASAKEINPLKSDAENLFRRWAVKTTEDGEHWARLVQEDHVRELIAALFPDNIEDFDSSLWADIEESIQDNIGPPPEDEFVVNCFEYLDNRNYRMAVVESVMCLDIVTSQYLKSYLASYKKIPANRIDLLLQPQLGLSARIAGLLDLCLHPEELKNVEFGQVLKAIKWRNNIIHKSGHLPPGLQEEIIRKHISSVLKLVFLLAKSRNQIESIPEMQVIGTELSKRMSVPFPNIWVAARHRVIMEFEFFVIPSEYPALDKLEAIVQEAITLLSERDKRFRGEEHLYVRFFRFPKELRAVFRNGKINPVPASPTETTS